jgi:hypothetical protein
VNRTIIQLLSLLALTLSESTYANKIEECVNANPNNVSDVRRCMSKMPKRTMDFISVNSCLMAKKGIAESQGHRDMKSNTVPSCRVISDALMAQNDKRPPWHDYIDYDGSQPQLNKAFAAAVDPSFYSLYKEIGLPCEWGWVKAREFPDSSDVLQGNKVTLTCDMINQAFLANGWKMRAAECMHYKPDDEQYLETCMTDTLIRFRQQGKQMPSCDEGRNLYQELVQIGNAEKPKDYSEPPCSSMNSVIAKVYTNAAIAPTPTAQAPVPVQQPQHAPVQPQPETRRVVAEPVVATPAPTPITQPAPQQIHTPPTPAPQPAAVTHQPSTPQETSEQRRERKAEEKMEKMEKVQSGLNTVNQVMGLFGGAGNATTNQTTANQTAATETPPPEQETKDERKARETTETINQATDTINTLKGLFGK